MKKITPVLGLIAITGVLSRAEPWRPLWREVTVHESERDYELDTETVTWTTTTYCYRPEERGYEVCGVESPVPAPPQALWLDWEEVWE